MVKGGTRFVPGCALSYRELKRKDRYLAMFKLLGPSVRGDGKRVRFEDAVQWSMRYLRKDDRIVWYLSILQRFALLKISGKPKYKNRRLRKKIERKLTGWKEDRIISDFHDFSHRRWEHFASVQAVYLHPVMTDYSFHEEEEPKPLPKPVVQVFADFEKFEDYLQKQPGSERFCSDGVSILEFADGWAWFGVEEGFSQQEAIAMRHCGNGVGHRGDYLLSLREPVSKRAGTFWKPHLTFILNKGFLGEMKGFANQKPQARFHPYVEALLKNERIHGLRGGGYAPKCNFSFLDLEQGARVRILEEKPDLVFDPIEANGRKIMEIPGIGEWQMFEDKDFPRHASDRVLGWGGPEVQWLVLRSSFSTSRHTHYHSLAWCWLNKGVLSNLHMEQKGLGPQAWQPLLESPLVHSLTEDPLSPQSGWNELLSLAEMDGLAFKKPGFFRRSPLPSIFDKIGLTKGFSKVVNDRFGLKTVLSSDGLELESYESLVEFAGMTGVGSMPRKMHAIDKEASHARCDVDVFQLPWLTLRRREDPDSPYSLNLKEEAAMHFFQTLSLSPNDKRRPESLLREIIYRFGPPDPSLLTSDMAA
jgi:hypothetical protein